MKFTDRQERKCSRTTSKNNIKNHRSGSKTLPKAENHLVKMEKDYAGLNKNNQENKAVRSERTSGNH